METLRESEREPSNDCFERKRQLVQRTSSIPAYFGKTAVLTTMHGKCDAIARPLKAGLGLELITTTDVDTDELGTFTGEIERKGSPVEAAAKKARIGMDKKGHVLGVASEGSFGPHPLIPFIAGHQEVMVFIDDDLGIQVVEHLFADRTNYAHVNSACVDEIRDFLVKIKFPSHAVIVRPSILQEPHWLSKLHSLTRRKETIFKGIKNEEELATALSICKELSSDGLARIETDMRAHMNPTRQRVIRRLAVKLARRLQSMCNECGCPGWGITDVVRGLPCSGCGYPSDAPKFEIHSCVKCSNKAKLARLDGITHVDPRECHRCNP